MTPRLKETFKKDIQPALKEQFAVPRRSEILDTELNQDIESLIEKEDMVVTLTNGGYIKRTPLSTYRAQKRGGKGRAALSIKEEDFVRQLFVFKDTKFSIRDGIFVIY